MASRFSTKEKFKILSKELLIRILTFNYLAIKKIIRKEFKIKDREKVLDIGCGTGILSSLFLDADYTGIDIDKNLIQFARAIYKNKFLVMSADCLKLPNNSFDKIVVVGVIHHLDNKTSQKAFSEMKKVLKKQGKILLIEAIPPISKYNLLGKLFRSHDKGEFVRTLDEYEAFLKDEFKIIKKYKRGGGIFDYGVFVLGN